VERAVERAVGPDAEGPMGSSRGMRIVLSGARRPARFFSHQPILDGATTLPFVIPTAAESLP
jgi:hypothetical protein